jgi:hypothetical protein
MISIFQNPLQLQLFEISTASCSEGNVIIDADWEIHFCFTYLPDSLLPYFPCSSPTSVPACSEIRAGASKIPLALLFR